MDFSSKNLLKLVANGKDSANAEDFREALDAILGVGKFALGAQVKQLEQIDEKGNITSVANKFVKSLKAEINGTEVSWTLPRPSELEAAVGDLEGFIGNMFGGPGGFPGGPPPGAPGGFGPPGRPPGGN